MTTPSEEEARALIYDAVAEILETRLDDVVRLDLNNLDDSLTFDILVAQVTDAALAALASRVSTPPSPASSEDWEYATPFDSEDEDGNPTRCWVRVNPATTDYPVFRKPKGDWEPVPTVPVLPTEPEEKR